MSLGQDIIFMTSRGKCKPPKHIGLSQALHQKTQSKDLVTPVNRFGHGVSCEEVQRIDTCWSEIQMDSLFHKNGSQTVKTKQHCKNAQPSQRHFNRLAVPKLSKKKPSSKHLLGKINTDWFKTWTPEHQQLKEID